jgi:hypothetical protein
MALTGNRAIPMSELGPSPLAAGEKHLSVAEARAAIAAALRPIGERESLPLAGSC